MAAFHPFTAHPAPGPTRLNSDGSLDESFGNVNAFAISLAALQGDGKVLATYYTGLGGVLERLNPDGTVDQSFNLVMTSPTSVAVEQDSIYIASNTVTRLHVDGTVDSSFAPVFSPFAQINQLLLQVDGQIIAAGNFTQVSGAAVNGIVRLNGVAPEKVANISTRASVGIADAVEIGGFIITGMADKSVIVRAIGPSMQVNGSPLAGTLSNPRVELHDSTGQLIAQSDDWRESQEAEIIASGLAPLNDRESAIVATLMPGAYTAVVHGDGEETGIALVEVYDTSPDSNSRLQNISTRGSVQNGDDVMIAGLILSGPESAPIVARAIGPSLAAFDVANPLSDPMIEVHDQSGAIIASNDDWKATQEAELIASELAPTNDKEAALIATLPPGPYTAIVRGANGATGVGLVEFYDTR